MFGIKSKYAVLLRAEQTPSADKGRVTMTETSRVFTSWTLRWNCFLNCCFQGLKLTFNLSKEADASHFQTVEGDEKKFSPVYKRGPVDSL